MQKDNLKNETHTDANNVLVDGLVRVLKTPISERYCKVGDEATLDVKNKQIRCGGVWFNFDERWSVQPCH
jgi:hypothetical protein